MFQSRRMHVQRYLWFFAALTGWSLLLTNSHTAMVKARSTRTTRLTESLRDKVFNRAPSAEDLHFMDEPLPLDCAKQRDAVLSRCVFAPDKPLFQLTLYCKRILTWFLRCHREFREHISNSTATIDSTNTTQTLNE
jgi:hypothetical protein